MKINHKGFYSILLVALSAGYSSASQADQHLIFSSVEALSPEITQDQCKAFFAPTVISTPTIKGTSLITKPLPITKFFVLTSLNKKPLHGINDHNGDVIFVYWTGAGNLSLDEGKTFKKIPVEIQGSAKVSTHGSAGIFTIGDFCTAHYESIFIKKTL